MARESQDEHEARLRMISRRRERGWQENLRISARTGVARSERLAEARVSS